MPDAVVTIPIEAVVGLRAVPPVIPGSGWLPDLLTWIFLSNDGITGCTVAAPGWNAVDTVLPTVGENFLQVGQDLLVDEEELLTTAIDLIGHTITVQRGYGGTTPAVHAEGADLYLTPFSSRISAVGNFVTQYSLGGRVEITQSDGVRYAIETAAPTFDGTKTIRTLLVQRGKRLLDEPGMALRFSMTYAPLGFPLRPSGFTCLRLDSNDWFEVNPVQNQPYEMGNIALKIPPGVWRVSYQALVQIVSEVDFIAAMGAVLMPPGGPAEPDESFDYSLVAAGPNVGLGNQVQLVFKLDAAVQRELDVTTDLTIAFVNLQDASMMVVGGTITPTRLEARSTLL